MDAVPVNHLLQAIAEALVHRAPFFAVGAAVTPAVRRPGAVPLVVNVDAGVAGMSDIALWNRVQWRDGVAGRWWSVAACGCIYGGLDYVSIVRHGTMC